MKVISYNLRKNRALGEIHALAERHRSDILCLQEADPLSLPATLGHLRLAGATEQNRLGLALYVSDERFETLETRTVALKKSLHDRVLAPAHEGCSALVCSTTRRAANSSPPRFTRHR